MHATASIPHSIDLIIMPTKNKQPTLIRRINFHDMTETLELVSQIKSTEDLVQSAHAQFTRELENPHPEEARFVATYDGTIVGTMGCGPGPIPSTQVLWADWLIVDFNHRRQNIASLLYKEINEFALNLKKSYLCLDIGNIDNERAAYTFHLRNGFQVVGQIPDYWGKFEHLNIMAKCLISNDRH